MSWKTIQRMANEAVGRLGLPHKKYNDKFHPDSDYLLDNAYTLIRLRNTVHDLEIEIMRLNGVIEDNKRARMENKAVKDAWDQYQMTLQLVKK